MLGFLVMLVLGAGLALAKKGGKPPPEPPLDSGTIYFYLASTVHQMDPDGTNVTALSSKLHTGHRHSPEPSHALHGGDRWFLQAMPILDETYPNGGTRHELFAVNASGTREVQLTDDPAVEPTIVVNGQGIVDRHVFPRWTRRGTVEDGKASYVARRWVELTDGTFEIQDPGIYVVDVDPDSLDASTYTAQEPTYIDLTVDTYSPQAYGTYADCYHDWSPDGTSLIYLRRDANKGLWRADASDGFANPVRLTMENAWEPRWSPNGDLIVFHRGGISTITPDGTGETVVIADGKKGEVGRAHWSPNGTHLTYRYLVRNKRRPQDITKDVYRAVADGTHQTNITAGLDDLCRPIGWRD
ncbi:MAG: TolB family protein [Planctomycetota bacterium]